MKSRRAINAVAVDEPSRHAEIGGSGDQLFR
jgi:hypothetical protein